MKHKLFFPIFVFALLVFSVGENLFAQARIVFGTTSDVYMVMGNTAASMVQGATTPIYLVIGDATGNAATNTITRTNHGAILSDGELNIVKWYIGNGTGDYTIPWAYSTIASYAGNYIPFTFHITGAGTANQPMAFSTYRTATYNNLLYLPNGVTNDWSSACACNASPWMVDRFWMIDNSLYTSTPTGQLKFSYVDGGAGNAEVFATGSSIVEANLQAESYNNAPGKWTGALYGTDYSAAGADSVGLTGDIAAPKLYKWWTLVDKTHPLPVTWLKVSAECNNKDLTIRWSTASEQNSDYFTVERSEDGTNFTSVATVPAAGNSSTIKNYFAVDHDAYSGTSFYRVKETDFNGDFSYSSTITTSGCSGTNDVNVYGSNGEINISINAVEDGQYDIEVFSTLGQRITEEIKDVSAGSNNFKLPLNNPATEIYFVRVKNEKDVITKKVFVGK